MLDPRLIRADINSVAEQLKKRGFELDVATLEQLESKRKHCQVHTEQLQSQRNTRSKLIGQRKAAGENIDTLLEEVSGLGEQLDQARAELAQIQQDMDDVLLGIPNLPHESVPLGRDENDNVEVRRWGEPRVFDFEVRDHVDLGAAGSALDFEVASKLTGSRFVVMQGPMARLHRALTQFMLDLHTSEHGYTEAYVPYIVNRDSLRGTNFQRFVQGV